jgi:hypothetical protein
MFFAAGITLVATHPRIVLVVLAYTYLASAFVGMALTRVRHRDEPPVAAEGGASGGAGGEPDHAANRFDTRDTAAR